MIRKETKPNKNNYRFRHFMKKINRMTILSDGEKQAPLRESSQERFPRRADIRPETYQKRIRKPSQEQGEEHSGR